MADKKQQMEGADFKHETSQRDNLLPHEPAIRAALRGRSVGSVLPGDSIFPRLGDPKSSHEL